MDKELDQKKEIGVRLRRLEGQVRGLEKMIAEDADCEEILVQFSAIKAAFEKVGMLVVTSAVRDCVKDEMTDMAKLDKAINILGKYLTYLK